MPKSKPNRAARARRSRPRHARTRTSPRAPFYTVFSRALNRWSPQQIGAAALLIAFTLIYWATLDTGLQPYELRGGDLITHQYAQVQARPSNAPGYPLYTMGGWLWFHSGRGLLRLLGNALPNPMPILSSYSTLWALLALWLFYRVILIILGDSLDNQRCGQWTQVGIALLLSAFYGCTYFFWYYATTTEQYSSAVAQTLALLYVYLLWEERPEDLRLLFGMALLSGLSLAHMLTVAFMVPPLVGVILWRKPDLLRNGRAILGSIVAAALPLLGYIYVYVRGALNPQWWGAGSWETPQAWFWSFVATAQGREELAWAFEPDRPLLGNGFPHLIWQELSIPLLVLGLIGIAGLRPRLRWLLWGTLFIYAIFCWFYRFGNWFQVILPAYPLILLGLLPFYQRLQARFDTTPRQRLAVPAVALAALVLALAWRIDASLPAANSRNRPEDTGLDRAALLLDQPLPDGASLFAAVDDSLALNYLLAIWQVNVDAEVVSSRQADDRIQLGQMVLSTADALPTLLAEISMQPFLQSVGPDWVQVARSAPASTYTIDERREIVPGLTLISAAVEAAPQGEPLRVAVPPAVDVVLSWELADGTWPEGVQISVRPLRSGNQIIDPANNAPIQQDRPRPVHGLYQAPAEIDPGTPIIVHDGYRLPLPPALAGEANGVLVIAYRSTDDGFENLAEIPYAFDPAAIGLAR